MKTGRNELGGGPDAFNGGGSYPTSSQGTETLLGLPTQLKFNIEQWTKLMEEMANEPREELSSEEFERRYPRKHTPYELQRIEGSRFA